MAPLLSPKAPLNKWSCQPPTPSCKPSSNKTSNQSQYPSAGQTRAKPSAGNIKRRNARTVELILVLTQKLSVAINNTKEEGNTLFKAGHPDKAIQRYTMAANIAIQRPIWEAQQVLREELSTLLSFEPNNAEMNNFLNDINNLIKKAEEAKRSSKTQSS
ncbi:hypothetical protein JAAARDRAFT_550730 [Jaapia argillacea MUCL 33604]|uniref:Uncharacterized protein n=1 Tax=Jaapia argillacea MUCL 33604 TaxID=933084 RepID=A0A067PJV3_9AGAM|nr:hypothetical protein JAAARDRAFT_550730 [Jaapia argillacea MUCL 33604]